MTATLRRLVPALVAALLASCAATSALAAPQTLRVGRQVQQLIVVSSPTAHPTRAIATLRAYDRASPVSPWRLARGPMPAETGYSGLKATRHEGDGTTPIGVFSIGATMYGNRQRPGRLHYAYHRLVCGDWWDEDPSSPRYNEFVRLPCGQAPPFAGNSEALWTEMTAYPYFALIDFNVDPVRRGAGAPGSGIFLHSWVGGPTAGCIAVHEPQLLQLLRWLRPSAHPRIAIGQVAEALKPGGPAPAILERVNRAHHWYCAREAWKRHVREDLVGPALTGLALGDDVLEVGPGFGPATEVLAGTVDRLTALEIDPGLAGALRERFAGRVNVVQGDATAMPFPDGSFSAAVCFTMLHHVPSSDAQNRLFAEVHRVLRGGALLAGTDSIGRGIGFALLHLGDVKVVVDPDGLPGRLQAAGFVDVAVDVGRDAFRFRARA